MGLLDFLFGNSKEKERQEELERQRIAAEAPMDVVDINSSLVMVILLRFSTMMLANLTWQTSQCV